MKKRMSIIIIMSIILLTLLSITNRVNGAEKTSQRKELALSSLEVENYEFYPEFNTNITKYYIVIPTDITELNVKAKAEDEDTKIKITGNTSIKSTESSIKITLSKSGATSKTYTLQVTKQKDNDLKLNSLNIENATLSPEFVKTKYYYNVVSEQNGEIKPLKIEAVANKENTKIEILGNTNLIEGNNNIITILLKNGNDITTYQLNVLVKKNNIIEIKNSNEMLDKITGVTDNVKEKAKTFFSDRDKKIATIVAGSIVLLVILFLIVHSKLKKRRIKKNKENIKKRIH